VGTLADYKLDNKPDLIIYSHVMEHVLDVNSEIAMINSICHEDTIVYIEVPGIKSIHLDYEKNLLKYFQNAHTFHFSMNALSNIFCKHGFKMYYGDEKIRSIFKKEPCRQPIKSDHEVILKYLRNQEKFRAFYYISPFGLLKMTKKRFSNIFKAMKSVLSSKN
jgi:predicted SAM-dependent methyltransferase